MNWFLKIFSSLKLTVLLLAFAMGLVFFGTLDQVNFGIHETQKRYFESFLVFWQYPQQFPAGNFLKFLKIPLLGGYALGILLLINLSCAHAKYFRPSWKKVGIVLIHAGLVLLIISAFVTSFFQEESQMWINLGASSNHSQSMRSNELVIIDKSNPESDTVTSIPVSMLKKARVLSPENLPFSLEVLEFYPNADIGLKSANPDAPETLATAGAGAKMGITVFPKKPTFKENEINAATAYIRIANPEDNLGTWLVSNIIDDKFPPQKFTYEGHSYEVALRFKRTYFPFSLHLLQFTHENYPGTDTPKNFSSLINIEHPSTSAADRQVLIYMNHPLRYAGYTFFQASFGQSDQSSMLQVVRNPGRVLPYYAVFAVGLGLLLHFIIRLTTFLRKK